MMKNRRGFTAIEMIIGIVVMTVLAALAVTGYQRYEDRSNMLVDETNQKVLQAAVKLYAYDTNALPGSLSQLQPRHIERAYALVTDGKRPYTLLAFFQENLGLFDRAEAAPLPAQYYNHDEGILTCPGDPTPLSEGGISYALAAGWVDQPLKALLDPSKADEALIVEADDPSSKRVVFRHGRGTLTVETSVKGDHKRKKGRAASPEEYRRRGWRALLGSQRRGGDEEHGRNERRGGRNP